MGSLEKSTTAVESCVHHWVIETPNGTFAVSRCKKCGAQKLFRNSHDIKIYDDDAISKNVEADGASINGSTPHKEDPKRLAKVEKLMALGDDCRYVLQAMAWGISNTEMEGYLGIEKRELNALKSKITNAASGYFEAFLLGFGTGWIEPQEEYFEFDLTETDYNRLELIFDRTSLDNTALKLNESADESRQRNKVLLDKIGANDRTHAMSILAYKQLNTEVFLPH